MSPISLRLRVAAAVAITCIAVVTALSLTIYTASEDLEETLVEQIVSEEMDFLVQHHRENPSIVRESGPNLQFYVARSDAELARMPATLRSLPAGSHEIGTGIAEQHVAVRDIDGTRFIVAYDAGPHETREQQFKNLILFALATVIVIATVAGYWISGLVTHQLTGLAARATLPDSGKLQAPFTQPDQDPEVGALALALDQYQARMREMVEREQEFTGNASHELRTPLTAIRTSCELLAAESGLSDRTRARIAAIAASAERMTGQLELLLMLARAQSVGARDAVALAECMRDISRPLLAEISRKGLTFENAIPADAMCTLNRQALDIVCANLLRNAVLYTESGKIRVTLDGNRLTVADTGIGIAAADLPHIFGRRFHRGAGHGEGSGLGLAIVKRICDAQGWHIAAESIPAQGSSFHVTFPRQA